ncbi:MAG TPA: tRNA preQ1(34) S-adenosylmethionine ribosyltransferase-isomerase QueA [Micropepsaceae bacterium]|nr:tRNA preQ1(34) S-adenosylmethionine ribosyltransferase-isomerase QueA [Micropepsaceae bacterium]
MKVEAFDFTLPDELIALRPVNPRDASRLLVVGEDGRLGHRKSRDLPELLRAGDMLVVNDSRVIPARLEGRRLAREQGEGAKIEVTLHRRLSPSSFLAFARPAKRLKPGDRLELGSDLTAEVVKRNDAEAELVFELAGAALDRAITRQGIMPLPPYIAGKRAPDARDRTDYQTVYAENPGSVAAPTAGFHFTPDLLLRLEQRGIARTSVTLHVGAGTFLPVTAEDTKDHRMHAEWAELPEETARAIDQCRASGGRIVAVGTTALRTLETAADNAGAVHPFRGETSLFITPGYRFKAVDILLTNFHLPRSTLFMLVCAFAGTARMRSAYAEAIAAGYRFYSYGDACLLFRAKG